MAVLYDVSADYLLKDDKQEGQTIEPGEEMDRPNTKCLGRINSIYWTIVIAVYLLVSIATGRWSTSWVLLYFSRRHLAHRGWFSLDQFD
ncbi:hypothetical protein ACXO22_08245 [Lactobacillus delbrueckii subsp. bulgaricus]